jgi:predicted DNA-binding transcriptional regulator AlpA
MREKPVTTRELAERLGVSIDTFYNNRVRMHAEDHLPLPLMNRRPFKWDRASIDAWFGRHHPFAPACPANDGAPRPPPFSDQQWQGYLAEAYSGTGIRRNSRDN